MADSLVGYVIEYLTSDDDSMRELALHWLCEGYMNEPQIAQTVFKQWNSRLPEAAYPTFPMLSYFPIAKEQIAEACVRAHAMAIAGEELTSLTTRCGGKLLEQVVQLPARDLQPHLDAILETAQASKIFFRVDIDELKARIATLDKSADELAEMLNEAVAALVENPDHPGMNRQGLRALEALRQNYPDYMDLSAVLKQNDSANKAAEVSLKLVLTSIVQFPGNDWLEQDLVPYLHDTRESILATTIEALIHRGTGLAAQVLFNEFASASENNRRWIARGLQRMRVYGLAPLIRQLRDKVSDHTLWLMLLVAELQQLDPTSGPTIVDAFKDLEAVSQAVIDAGTLYTFVCAPLQEQIEPQQLEASFRELLQRVHSKIATTEVGSQRDIRSIRRNQAKQIDKLYNKRPKA